MTASAGTHMSQIFKLSSRAFFRYLDMAPSTTADGEGALPPEQHATPREAAPRALHGLLEEVEDRKVQQRVVHEVVERHLARQSAKAGGVRQLFSEGLVRELLHAREQHLEKIDVDEPLHRTEVAETEQPEDSLPLPVYLLLFFYVFLY